MEVVLLVVQAQTCLAFHQSAMHQGVQQQKMLVRNIPKLESAIGCEAVRGSKRLLVVEGESNHRHCRSLEIQRVSFRNFRLGHNFRLGRRIRLARVELDFVCGCRRETFLGEVVDHCRRECMVFLLTWETLEIAC
jgi:hypothetical protein